MENSVYLFSAFSITWIILFLYVFSILKRQKALEGDIEGIREILKRRGKSHQRLF